MRLRSAINSVLPSVAIAFRRAWGTFRRASGNDEASPVQGELLNTQSKSLA
jgi:hypothetical protein